MIIDMNEIRNLYNKCPDSTLRMLGYELISTLEYILENFDKITEANKQLISEVERLQKYIISSKTISSN